MVPVANLGGVARHVLDVAAAGLNGWRLVVLCPEGPLAVRLRELETAVTTGPFGPDAGFRASFGTLQRTIQALNPVVVHSHLSYADVICATVLAANSRVRLITTEHGVAADDLVYHGSRFKSRIKAALHRARLKRADAVIAVSQATKSAMTEKWQPSKTVTVVPNGVDQKSAAGSRRTEVISSDAWPRILSFSRLAPEKRIPDLLRAFALLRANHPSATLTVAGEGPDLAELQELTEQLGLDGPVSFPGFLDPDQAMASADVLVQLSVWENCSYTLLDAINVGLGVVATPVGGNPEILPERCLVFVDDPAAVAARIERQASDPFERPRLPEAWPTVTAMVERTLELYAEVTR
ncbi:glycosyltransferase family 4 protein [Arthrobacter sp. ISL-28]|uniref:glycosyltransferase family 4 protein n=1 Tax=Arthrobacter sp. ISL-28 TaxID=2819108 RepID=UPI001BE5BB0C|nr:glycosyltransferase family 4 protein [Arthrobacter sp. ISL-28]MBT2519655.1 glycosyltransferase family 4 protein [Arthrobacter sp. ISL-28]